MKILQLNTRDVSSNSRILVPILKLFPEIFIKLIDDLPNSSETFREVFRDKTTEIKHFLEIGQILPNNFTMPVFINKYCVSETLSKTFGNADLFSEYGNNLYKDSNIDFYDEISFMLLAYKQINLSERRSDIQNIKNSNMVNTSSDTEKMCLYFQEKIIERIGDKGWKVNIFLRHKISPSIPNSSSKLLQNAWNFQTGRSLPHDRIWADSRSRIFISTSIGLEFNETHKPIIYRLSPSIRRSRAYFINY